MTVQTQPWKSEDYLTDPACANYYLLEILSEGGFGDKLVPYGSRFVCDPPVHDTDIDFFLYVCDHDKELNKLLIDHGFVESDEHADDSSRPSWGEADPDRRFRAYKKGLINLVTTTSLVFATRHITATHVCKKLNLLDKKDRIMIYQAILYGKFKHEED